MRLVERFPGRLLTPWPAAQGIWRFARQPAGGYPATSRPGLHLQWPHDGRRGSGMRPPGERPSGMTTAADRESAMSVLLVIDDDPLILRLVQGAFQESEITVRTAATAGEGLRLLAQDPPDLVLLDINLPDQSGLETYRQLQEQDGRVPVIFISADDTTDTAIEAMKLGAY